jgi:tetratricopeptide (TPR) repeat protein
VLENRLWKEAENLEADYAGVDWKKFPWQNAILHATRMMGAIHTGATDRAAGEMKILNALHDSLVSQKNNYQAGQVEVKIKTGEAWMQLKQGNKPEALQLMAQAADMEEKAEKHPVTPGEVIPAREYLADMLLQVKDPAKALVMYEACLAKNKNRFNGLYGAAVAARQAGNKEKAISYYRQLLSIGNATNSGRAELTEANDYLSKF